MSAIWKCLSCPNYTQSKALLFCSSCQQEIRQHMRSREASLQEHTFLKILAMAKYTGAWARFIVQLKMRSRGFLLQEEIDFLEDLVQYHIQKEIFENIDCIVAIPSHPIRSLFETNINQVLALHISKHLKKPIYPLLRVSKRWLMENGTSQKDRKTHKQRQNLIHEQKFKITQSVKPRQILLVDDVMTSGATLKCAKTLLENSGHKLHSAIVMGLGF
jgi:predicted amidophosphoribosyltransferase